MEFRMENGRKKTFVPLTHIYQYNVRLLDKIGFEAWTIHEDMMHPTVSCQTVAI